MSSWTLGPENGSLTLHTGVTGAAARMGHRLTIVMDAWTISVDGPDDRPSSAVLVVDVHSLRVDSGEGGLTPLTPPEKSMVRSNALKTLNAKRFPTIEFRAEKITRNATGYLMHGPLTVHGVTHAVDIDLTVTADGDDQQLSLHTEISQRAYGIKPFSMAMGSLKVADLVTVSFEGHRPAV
ncbi:YceI family protein [Mycobacteroides franklinii]|uniref:YceI-like domain protein n=1 Tax=Mycobacteroides franklinii TaxID=948102 RepID=A0A4V3HUZ0_9MYCO|nr:YceI family protein [Mycobacteroides franklinii]TDZ45803.1 YceI-like domain protein [Mycobacteroides franklinii]TDZ49293.1 YceI-like domain protein [Mycobacteroides franklinii]TDZ59473.1 YceI-like domain protein [Mycobacteroides franklinii]TDZ66988.1 YceI-like domain protein [Mycobacteroides franklinii]TDZ72912.1 YceI-like domain protein [Mycobacteroides franklinii]